VHFFLSGHSYFAIQARGHKVGGPRGASSGTNHMNLVAFPESLLAAVNTSIVWTTDGVGLGALGWDRGAWSDKGG
jgi:hypothetical protein